MRSNSWRNHLAHCEAYVRAWRWTEITVRLGAAIHRSGPVTEVCMSKRSRVRQTRGTPFRRFCLPAKTHVWFGNVLRSLCLCAFLRIRPAKHSQESDARPVWTVSFCSLVCMLQISIPITRLPYSFSTQFLLGFAFSWCAGCPSWKLFFSRDKRYANRADKVPRFEGAVLLW